MFNFTNSQFITSLQNIAHSYFIHFKCIDTQRGRVLNLRAWQKAWQCGRKRGTVDFKGFLVRGKRGTATNAAAWHQPPLPPLGGRGLPRSSRHGFYSLNTHMQCRRMEKRPVPYLQFFATSVYAKRRRDNSCNKTALYARACARFGR